MKTYEICGFFLVLLKIANSTLEKTNVTLQIQTVKCEQPNVKLIAQFLSTVKKPPDLKTGLMVVLRYKVSSLDWQLHNPFYHILYAAVASHYNNWCH